MGKVITALENLELLVGRLTKQQTLDLIQTYLDDNDKLISDTMKTIEQNNICLKLLNAKLKGFANDTTKEK
jgi:hypothetical protein